MYHQDFAGNCIERPTYRCLSDGVGGRRFDCSGLILASINDMTGGSVGMTGPRHVRDMWQAAHEQSGYRSTSLAIGALAIFRRNYTVNGTLTDVPGHIGIVSGIQDTSLVLIRANSRSGKVEESPLEIDNNIMGYITPVLEEL